MLTSSNPVARRRPDTVRTSCAVSVPAFAETVRRDQRAPSHFLPSRDYKSNKAAGSIGLPNISFHCDFWSSVSLARRSASRSSRILITLP